MQALLYCWDFTAQCPTNARIWNRLLAQAIAIVLEYQKITEFTVGQCLIFKDPRVFEPSYWKQEYQYFCSQVPSLTVLKTCSNLS